MTIQGAMKELVNLLNADDIPIYYKGGIKKAIETIDDYIDGKDDYVKRKTETQTYITEDRDTQILDAWQVHHRNTTSVEDEPQTKCYLRTSCDHYGDKQVCGRCREYNLYSHTKTEPQTDCTTCEHYATEDCENGCVGYEMAVPQPERSK